ncbi:hypothetical protein ACGGZK_07610 [Agromyces sp. MMS24-K17]|uniref:hypothetical protein n=1 Tax=Agromyces sp. MMS24-K17 TaxID=3372850 RepID=UPI003754FEFD
MANRERPPAIDPDDADDVGEFGEDLRGGGTWRTVAVVGGIVLVIVIALVVAISLSSGGSEPEAIPVATSTPGPSDPPSTTAPATEAALPVVPSVAPGPIEQPPPADPVPIDATAEIAPSLTARISKIEAVEGEAQGPGEVAGPAIRITVEIDNATNAASSLETAVVTTYFGSAMTPASELREPGGKPFPSSVAAGDHVEAVYVFAVPTDQRDDVTIMVDYSLDYAPLQFHGAVPR